MQSLEEVAICDVYPYERADGEPMNPRDFTTRESAEHIEIGRASCRERV